MLGYIAVFRNISVNFSYLCGMFRYRVRGKIHFDIPLRKHDQAIYSNISRLQNVHFQMIFYFFFLVLLQKLIVGTS